MAATPVPERIAFAPPRSPFVSAAACTSDFSTLRMNRLPRDVVDQP